MLKHFFKFILYVVLLLVASIPVYSQESIKSTTIKGLVCDSISREPIPYVAIFFKGTDNGLLTNENGEFNMTVSTPFSSMEVSSMGYKSKVIAIAESDVNDLLIELVPEGVALNEVVVNYKKEKYSKKNNPAVDFVEKLRARKADYNPENKDYYTYDKHTKTTFGLNDFDGDVQKRLLGKKFSFILDYLDTCEVTGKSILNVMIEEKIGTQFYRKSPRSNKELITAIRREGIDESFDEESVHVFLDDVLREVDIYTNDITIMQKRFVSPLSNIGVNFYKYYLTDTIQIDSINCIELSFVPFTSQSDGFIGRIYVPIEDSTMFIKRVKLNVPKNINLNYVDNLYLEQDFVKAADGTRLKVKDDIITEFKLVQSAQGLYARRQTMYKNHNFDEPSYSEVFTNKESSIVAKNALYMSEDYWAQNRQIEIKPSENSVGKMIENLRKIPVFYWIEKVVSALVNGYVPTSKESKFDIGPLNTFLGGNTVEGFRMRVGGTTTANLSKHLFASGYIAYGFRDEKLKYKAELEYSFNEKKYHPNEFPKHSIKALHCYDINQVGQHYIYTNQDNVFLALKRQKNDKVTYLRTSGVQYSLETHAGFSITAGFNYNTQEATRWLPFVDGNGKIYTEYNEAQFNLSLRFAPGEKFYQTSGYRFPINYDAPIITLTQTFAPKNFLGSLTTINKTELGVFKRFWFSAFGYSDVILKAGKVWSDVNYTDLLIPNANLSYTIQPESFALMNPMEFVNDQYVSWDLTYWANGILFNHIPVIKQLKLREVISFRGVYGQLSDINNPEFNSKLFRFPAIVNCMPMEDKPYMELGVGIDNIFKILRLDYVWRLTYRDTPGVDKSGLRLQLHFTF